MKTVIVQDSLRKKRRELKDALGDDILRYIAELITNCDDSYRRLENYKLLDKDITKNIYIEVNQDKENNSTEENYVISITDNAEGMTAETLEKIFGTYGGDNAGGNHLHARGIFGQGASDVLRAAANENRIACVETIKNNKITKLVYHMNDELEPSINIEKIKLTNKKLKKYREAYKIPENGTRVSFGVPSTVKFKNKIRENLPNLIEKYPSFRYLLNQSNRKVFYDNHGLFPLELSSKDYQFDESKRIISKKFNFNFEDKKIECVLKLYINENKKSDGTNIIVRDENYNVFDNTMFDFSNSVASQNISGELLIDGLYDLCYEHLNSDNPDAIVRDNRTGFDTKNLFYDTLCRKVDPIIEEVLEQYGKDVKTTNITNNKKFNDALKKLNKYLASEIKENIKGGNIKGDINPPVEGIKFSRLSTSITKGNQSYLNLYINSNLISSSDNIKIIASPNNSIEISPKIIQYDVDEINNGLIIKNILVKGLECTTESIIVKAICQSRVATIAIDVVDMEIYYPENGFEFFPKESTSSYNSTHNIKLFIDSNIVPLNSEIKFSSDELAIEYDTIVFDKKHLVNDNIGIINISLTGGNLDQTYIVEASYNKLSSIAKITLIEPSKNNDNNGGGLIAGFKLESSTGIEQSYFNPYTHMIMINTRNPINIKIMGDMKDKNYENPTFTKEQQKYLCDIIAVQAANILVKEKNIKNGEINFDSVDDAIEKMQYLIQEHKNKIYQELYSSFETLS